MATYPKAVTGEESSYELVEYATEYLTKAVHSGVDQRHYQVAKRALTALAYLHPN